MISILRYYFLLALCLVLLAACSGSAPDPLPVAGTNVVKDGIGREVVLPADIKRAISLAPNITEIVFAVGAGDKLVGVTAFCNYPAAAAKIQKVGDTLKPNIETIVALRPQVVFVSTASQLEAFTDLLEIQGIKVFVSDPDSLESVFDSIKTIGKVLGKSERSTDLVEKLRDRVQQVREKAGKDEGPRPRVFVQIDKSLYTVGKGSFITDLISIAGGRSVTADLDTAYPKISREAALAYDPDVIVISESPDNREPNDVFGRSKAVKQGRIVRINADILSRPGPRTVDALELIYRGIHGGEGQGE